MTTRQTLRKQRARRHQEMKEWVKNIDRQVAKNNKHLKPSTTVEVNPRTKLVTLGPCYPGDMPAKVEELLGRAIDDSCYFSGAKWDKWDKKYGWPTSNKEWGQWLNRVESAHGDAWKRLGIYDAIKILVKPIDWDRSVLSAGLCFWNSATNTLDLSSF